MRKNLFLAKPKNYNKLTVLQTFVLGPATSFLTTLFIYRKSLTDDFLMGEPFDTRLMIIIHEHWFKFLDGSTSFLDAKFFYPVERSFSFTDSFLLTGLTHAAFRATGIDIVQAWNYSQMVWTFIGLFGWYLLARKLLQNKFLQILLVPFIGTSFPFIAHLNERPNVIPYLLISWIFLFIFESLNLDKYAPHNTRNLGFLIISIPLLILTSWYPGFFISVFLFTIFLLLYPFNKDFRLSIRSSINSINFYLFIPFVVLAFLLSSLWAYIYLPVLSGVANFRRPVEEVLFGSPRLNEVFVANALGGSPLGYASSVEFNLGDEELIGLNLLLLLFLFLLYIIFLFQKRVSLSGLEIRLLTSVISILVVFELMIIKFIGENSIFLFLWTHISFLKSIRTPVRWHIFATFIVIFILFYLIDKINFKNHVLKVFFIFGVLGILFIDQYRDAPGLWKKNEFISQDLLQYKESISECEAYILDRPAVGMWKDIIEGMILTLYIDRPTVNGYSGGFPPTYPLTSWYVDGDLPALGAWLERNGTVSNVCVLDGINFDKPINYSKKSDNLRLGNGFTNEETNGKDTWFWSVWNSSTFYIYNTSNKNININLDFDLIVPECINSNEFKVVANGIEKKFYLSGADVTKFSANVSTKAWDRLSVNITGSNKFCNFEDDPRNLYFSIKNLKIKMG